MRLRRSARRLAGKIDLNMTPLIDIVFQLLTFFIMSLRISAAEGDFLVRMPSAPRVSRNDSFLAPFRLRICAHNDGSLRSVAIDGQTLVDDIRTSDDAERAFATLHREVIVRLGDQRGPGSVAEEACVEFHCDYALDYEHVIAAITAVSGYASPDDGRVIKLIERIQFAPPRSSG